MSMSTSHTGGSRRPERPSAGGKPGERGKAGGKSTAAAKTGARGGGGGRGGSGPGRGGGGKGGKGRRPVAPVKVASARPWGTIAMFTAVGVAAVAIIGYTAWASTRKPPTWEDKIDKISGVHDFRKDKVSWLTRNHKQGPLKYQTTPPVGGDHNPLWQNCSGDVYNAQIPNEHAVHSLEHGAVWITYRPGLPKDQITALSKKVSGQDYTFMSPYPGLDKPISIQVWGIQLKVDKADDERIDKFISTGRGNASQEPGASCSGGNTTTGTTPQDTSQGNGTQGGGMPPGN